MTDGEFANRKAERYSLERFRFIQQELKDADKDTIHALMKCGALDRHFTIRLEIMNRYIALADEGCHFDDIIELLCIEFSSPSRTIYLHLAELHNTNTR